MQRELFAIKDRCRAGLTKYTLRAFAKLPEMRKPVVLDMGCGTGVPTLALLEATDGEFYAVDSDRASLEWLNEKGGSLPFHERLHIVHASAFDYDPGEVRFDVVLAEGFLNVVGFNEGLPLLMKLVKQRGFLILHDEVSDVAMKREAFQRFHCRLLDCFELDESAWGAYYECLEGAIAEARERRLFEKEIREIGEYRRKPGRFCSMYYVLRHGG